MFSAFEDISYDLVLRFWGILQENIPWLLFRFEKPKSLKRLLMYPKLQPNPGENKANSYL